MIKSHNLDPRFCDHNHEDEIDNFSACMNARGVYESKRFALRLSPVVHERFKSLISKSDRGENHFTEEEIQAYSTYLHETVHWWQHKGSTSGFLRSILYPIQTHTNMSFIRKILNKVGPQKPIKTVAYKGELGQLPPDADEVKAIANTVINNFMDTEFYLAVTHSPKLAESACNDKYFESTGHTFITSYVLVLVAIKELLGDKSHVLPDPEKITQKEKSLHLSKKPGYYYGSQVMIPPLGLYEIFEGQARFIQLQFLTHTYQKLRISDIRSDGMLNGIYGVAFDFFLKHSNSQEPEFIKDPLVALFLVLCDISINPTAGFPTEIKDYDTFFLDVDPGVRFFLLCRAINFDAPELKSYVKNYSKIEYNFIVEKLTSITGLDNHMVEFSRFRTLADENPITAALLQEHKTFKFSQGNTVLQVLTGEFLSFIRDKLDHPEFFCWAGHWKGNAQLEIPRQLWLKHLALFSDNQYETSLYPISSPNREEKDLSEVFSKFFSSVIIYDITRQLVLQTGEFKHEYSWLTSEKEEVIIPYVKSLFKKTYNTSLDDFEFLKNPE